MGIWRLAAAGLLILLTSLGHAEVRNINAGDEDGLIQAVLDANANPSEVMVVVVKGTGTFEFTDDFEDSGFALPPLEGSKLALLIEKSDVTFFLNPSTAASKSGSTTQSLGFFELGPYPTIDERDDAFLSEVAIIWFGGLDLFSLRVGRPKPKVTRSGAADGPIIKAGKGGVALSGMHIESGTEDAVEGQNARVVMDGTVVDGGAIDVDSDSADDIPRRSGMADFLDEVNDAYSASHSGSAQKAFAAELDATVARLKELTKKGTYTLSNTAITGGPFGSVSMRGAGTLHVQNSMVRRGGFSSAIGISGVTGSTNVILENSVISHPNIGAAIFARRADLVLDGVTVEAEDALKMSDEASVTAYRSILGIPGTSDRDPACEFDSFSAKLTSLGYNISADSSCGLTKSTDRQNTNPRLREAADGGLIPGLAPNSPAIDGGPSRLVGGELPCGTTDVLGTARPQDGDGDGRSACDIGAIEVASRAGGIDGRQSGAYYDLSRNGEGVFVEMLSSTTALVYLFSYTPSGEPFWALGVGTIVGNGIVIRKQDFLTTRGATFGADFDPADVEFIPFADVSLSFPDCRNTAKTGSLSIAANDELGFGPLLSETERLTFVMDCRTRETLGPGFSGSFFDPTHDGEGIILQFVDATTVVVQWFTYDAQGNQYWIQGVGTLSGGTITVDEALSFRGPSYGAGYDAGDLVPIAWGSITIEIDCDTAKVRYNSMVAGFGQGMLNMERLTSLRGVDCS